MDALRKAEQQKQKLSEPGQSDQPSASPALELEPISVQATASPPAELSFEPANSPAPENSAAQPTYPAAKPGPLPELPARMEDLDAQFTAPAPQPATRKPAAAPPPPLQSASKPAPGPAPSARRRNIEISPASARQLFDAKQPAQPKIGRSFVLAASTATLLAGLGIGGYVWWEIQPKGSLVAGNISQQAMTPRPPPKPDVPAPPPAPVAAIAVAAPPPEATAQTNAATPPVLASPVAARPDVVAEEPSSPPPPKRERTAAAPPLPKPEAPLRVSSAPQRTDPALEVAYQAFNRGDAELARSNWKRVLAGDPRNSDALHGLAALALQANQPGEAADFYLRALENDPKDALALAGLLSLKAPADVMQAESRLKMLLAEQPDSPHLNFALGNLYARGTRWAEAQQSYFKAHAVDPANPDYLFNLAVSLDQLHQPRLAAQFYGKAIDAAAQQPAGFDTTQAATRLKALQSGR